MDKVYVFGHKMPDTDSVCSAIAMSYFLNNTREDLEAIPRVLGSINNETKFVLERFGVDAPKYLNDVKLQIRDVNYRKDLYVDKYDTIKNAYDLMTANKSSGIPIVDTNNNNKLEGLITLKELARDLIETDRRKLCTSYDNILKVLDGKELLRYDEEIVGNIITATFRSTTFLADVELHNDDILVIGDRHSILEYAIESGVKLIILVANSDIKEVHLEEAKKKKVNIIKTDKSSFDVSNLLSLSNYAISIKTSQAPVTIKDNDFLTDFEDLQSKYAYSNYPVISNDDKCLGMLRITDVSEKTRKKVILVDHNEKNQSVDGLEEAEIIDHHRLGTISTSTPINFRNMSVGSTCTIIFGLFQQYGIMIPDSIAGILLSAILSDTLILKGPTKTDNDVAAVKKLAQQLNIDYEKYGLEMFKAGSSLKDKTIEEIIYQDFKQYNAEDTNIGIGQVFTTNYEEIEEHKDDYIRQLNNMATGNNYDIVCLFVTNIITNGSNVLFNDKAQNTLALAYDIPDISEGQFLPNIVSRKKQIISAIIDVIERK